jgi:hypothetical protein
MDADRRRAVIDDIKSAERMVWLAYCIQALRFNTPTGMSGDDMWS